MIVDVKKLREAIEEVAKIVGKGARRTWNSSWRLPPPTV